MEVKISVDDGDVLAIYIKLSKGEVSRTLELCPDECLLDLDAGGKILGVEFLTPGHLRLAYYRDQAKEKCPYPDLENLFQELASTFGLVHDSVELV